MDKIILNKTVLAIVITIVTMIIGYSLAYILYNIVMN